jgi:hypothetical protein
MIELVTLLSVALTIMVILGLLLAGFMWMPWLIGLGLIILLVSLKKASTSDPQTSIQLAQGDGGIAPEIQSLAQPTESTAQPLEQSDDSVMLYRGVKYKRHSGPEASQSANPSANASGKYRGQVWKRSEQ